MIDWTKNAIITIDGTILRIEVELDKAKVATRKSPGFEWLSSVLVHIPSLAGDLSVNISVRMLKASERRIEGSAN